MDQKTFRATVSVAKRAVAPAAAPEVTEPVVEVPEAAIEALDTDYDAEVIGDDDEDSV